MIRSASLVALLVGLLFSPLSPAQAQDRGNEVPRLSPNAAVSQTIGVTEVEITYGRPKVRGREIFGGLVPFDEVWRTGANEATTVSFSTPVQIEGQSLEAGTYGFFTIPGPDEWTLVFNDEPNQWGAYNYDANSDVLRVQVEPESAPKREMLTFTFHDVTDRSATCALHWAETRVPFEITTNTNEIIRTQAESTVSETEDWEAPLQYVRYALENEVLLEEALGWVNRSIELNETFDNLRMKAHVLAAQGQHGQAVDVANTALSKAEAMSETPDGVEDLRKNRKKWQSM